MGDRVGGRRFVGGADIDRRYADMGDGTHAEVVATKSLDPPSAGGSGTLQANVHKYVEAAMDAETAVWMPAAGKRYRFMGGVVSVTTAGVVRFRDGVAGPAVLAVNLPANGSIAIDLGEGIVSGAVGRPLTAFHSSGGIVAGVLQGREE